MKKILYILILFANICFAQQEANRIEIIKSQLTALSIDNNGLTEQVKSEINVNNTSLSVFLLAIAEVHELNINVAPELSKIQIANNFNNVSVTDLLVFLCKEYNLTIDFTGNILALKKYQKPKEAIIEKIIPISYNPNENLVSIDIQGDNLYDVFKRLMDVTGKNLVYTPNLSNTPLTIYLKDTPFDVAMEKLAYANNLYTEKTKDNFYLFESNGNTKTATQSNGSTTRPKRRRKSNFFFKVLDYKNKLLDVDFSNTPIADIIHDIGNELKIDVFTAKPLDEAGIASLKAKSITFDYLLDKIFEPQVKLNNKSSQASKSEGPSKNFTYKKEDNIYFFGTANQLSVRQVEIIHLMHRSVTTLTENSSSEISSMSNNGYNNQNYSGSLGRNNTFDNSTNRNSQQNQNSNYQTNQNSSSTNNSVILDIIPDDIKNGVEFKVDTELNSIYVSGTHENIQRFKKFIKKIDKDIPLVLIEVMFIEVNKNATIEAGVSWGIGENPTTTQGGLYPNTNITLGAKTINRIFGGFKGFGAFSLGQVVPNFFANIKAMENNGDLKIKSTPKLSTLNGHSANFSNGTTSYYAVTQRNIYGTDNPQTSEITNYEPVTAELGLTIKPYVSGNGNVTLSIDVIQSNFGNRIAENAPPDINSRNFNSSIRVQDQDIVILGGLEENRKQNSGTGVPLLSKIPILKWLFSSRKREVSKGKLVVLIKPTVIY